MGTQLQSRGLPTGICPEVLNIIHPEVVTQIHCDYINAGCDIIYANTFGANRKKLAECGFSVQEVVSAALENAKKARRICQKEVVVALDVGPIGELMEPTGTLTFEEAYTIFYEQIKAGIAAGAEFIVLETMTDLYEVKAGILAAKECCETLGKQIPILASMTFESNGRTFTGCSVPSMAATIEGLGADAIGFNCSLGPKELLPLAETLAQYTSLPIFIKANAGLPDPLTNCYHINAQEFASYMEQYLPLGICAMGGCCGTDPQFIREVRKMLDQHTPVLLPLPKKVPCVCTPTNFVPIDRVRIVGERINPTGKPLLKQAMLEQKFDYILAEGIGQVERGADILDINAGMPGLNEAEFLPLLVKKLQSVLDTPLQIDSYNADAIENALRVFNGIPILNSINGEEASMQRLLPIAKKYGACFVALTLDEKGIPLLAEERFEIAKRIVERAESYGIGREKIFVDCLTLTASAQQKEIVETLKAMRMVKENLGVKTLLGVSNISFGLPNRELLNRSFLLLALEAGLDLPILNPNDPAMIDTIRAFHVLFANDLHAADYIETFSRPEEIARISHKPSAPIPSEKATSESLTDAIKKGLHDEVRRQVSSLLQEQEPQQIIETKLIPALDFVGKEFEAGRLFLPQMIQSAQAAQEGFAEIKNFLAHNPNPNVDLQSMAQKKILLATVQGDVHDIGKNIVKVILENYGYSIIDLGRDVPAQKIVESIEQHHIHLVGLSALMTTTLHSMEETIYAIREKNLDCKIMVGGAVLTKEYALKIGADFYAQDAKQSADIAKLVLG